MKSYTVPGLNIALSGELKGKSRTTTQLLDSKMQCTLKVQVTIGLQKIGQIFVSILDMFTTDFFFFLMTINDLILKMKQYLKMTGNEHFHHVKFRVSRVCIIILQSGTAFCPQKLLKYMVAI